MTFDLRAARRNKGLHLKDVAEVAGISESYLSMIERGQVVPGPPVALRLAEFYERTATDVWPDDYPVAA